MLLTQRNPSASRHLLARYLRPHWRRVLILAVILAFTIAVQVATPIVASRFIDQATGDGTRQLLTVLALVTVALAIVGQGASLAETYVAEFVSWQATNALREDLSEHLLRLDASFHNAHTPGELIERVDGDVSTVARFFSRFVVYVLGNGVLILGVLGLMFLTDWRVAVGLSAFVLIALVVMLKIRAAATPLSAAERQCSAEFYGFMGENLSGLEDIRSSGAGTFVLRRCAELMQKWMSATIRAGMRGYAMVASSNGLFALGTVFALALSAMRYRDGSLTIGAVYLIFRYTQMLRHPTEQIRNEIQDLQQAGASIGRIGELFASTPRLADGPGRDLPSGPLEVELDGVSFGYDPDTLVLHELNLRLLPGRVLGIVGRTGSGKTSLTRLVPRFYDPQEGVVRLGGVDVREVSLDAVRRRIGIVSQDIHLFDASVRDNLTIFDDRVEDARIIAALDSLGLSRWLRNLPEGLDSTLGSKHVGLSAGQSQVLACARILLQDPDIVILDEASSRLDLATERLVQLALGRLLEGRTGVIVAHRLMTVSMADDILVLEDGRVREYGPRILLEADESSHFSQLLSHAREEIA